MWIYLDQDFDGDGFMGLSEGDFKELFPSKMGTVKKLIRVQKTVCWCPMLHITGPAKTEHICTNYTCLENGAFLDHCLWWTYFVNFLLLSYWFINAAWKFYMHILSTLKVMVS